jgi:general secretion pathway protein K
MTLLRTDKSTSGISSSFTSNSITGKDQQGVAIITALLIVTIAATVSMTISTHLQLDVRRTSNLIAQDQADFYLLAAEEWSQRILRQDKKDTKIDELGEPWAIEIPPLPVAGGSIQGKLTDLHSCINVNSLINAGAVDTTTSTRMTQLFRNLGLNNISTQSIVDWIDSDMETTNPDGAEDGYYLNLDKPYRAANSAIQSVSELRLMKGFEDDGKYRQLKDYLCAFPTDSSAATGAPAINVNTASAEVLKSLSANMTDSLAKDIIDNRIETPFNDISEFKSFAGVGTIIKDTKNLSVSSNYFLLRTQAIIGQANKIMYSIIYRDDSGKTKIISRTYRTL